MGSATRGAHEVRDDGAGARHHAAHGDELVDVARVQVADDLGLQQVEHLHLRGYGNSV